MLNLGKLFKFSRKFLSTKNSIFYLGKRELSVVYFALENFEWFDFKHTAFEQCAKQNFWLQILLQGESVSVTFERENPKCAA